jgi:hypothetical protein
MTQPIYPNYPPPPPQAPAAPAPPSQGAYAPGTPPHVAYAPATGTPPNPYAGANQARVTIRTPPIPAIPPGAVRADYLLEFVGFERAVTGSGEFCFTKFKIIESAPDARFAGTDCGMTQDMNPKTKGGRQVAYAALKGWLFPLCGVAANDEQLSPHLESMLFELETKGTINGQSLVGRKVRCIQTPGQRRPNTPPDREPFPKQTFVPV